MSNKIADGHVHLENGPLTVEYCMKFIEQAKKKGLKKLQILDHTHRFFEFHDMYARVENADPRQKAWFEKKQVNSIREYHALIETMKSMDLGIDVTFGLEVCYSPENEDFLRSILSEYPYDFLVGAVHSIDGRLYDIEEFSKDLCWSVYEPSIIYEAYYLDLKQAIESRLFTQIAHPDVIKLYQIDPGYDLHPEYEELAQLAVQYHVKMEDNTGAHYRYHHPDVGLNSDFRNILKQHGAQIISCSDAHYPEHVAMDFELLP